MTEDAFSKYIFVDPNKAVFYNKFISEKFAISLLKDYNKFIDSDYKGNKILKSPKIYNQKLSNFNLYSSILMDKLLRKNGFCGIRFKDINKIIDENRSEVNTFLVDFGVVYRGIGYPEKKQAEYIGRQLMERGFNVNSQFSDFVPIVMSLSDLDVKSNDNFSDDIKLSLHKNSKPFYSKAFGHNNQCEDFELFDSKGPVFEKCDAFHKIRIRSYPAESGLARITLANGTKLMSSEGGFSRNFFDSRFGIINLKQ